MDNHAPALTDAISDHALASRWNRIAAAESYDEMREMFFMEVRALLAAAPAVPPDNAVYVCPNKDRECGDWAENWCDECPKHCSSSKTQSEQSQFLSREELIEKYGSLDANAIEQMARERPDECFLKGSGVLKLIDGIRTLERQLSAAPAAQPAASQGQPEPFGWVKSSEIEQSERYGGSINLWREKWDCDVPVFTTPPAPSIPTGMRLAPVEPTDAMWDAATREMDRVNANWPGQHPSCFQIYKAMIGAAPSVPAGWISVKDRLPETEDDVLATDGKDVTVGNYSPDGFETAAPWIDVVTHWMPMPAAPSAGETQ